MNDFNPIRVQVLALITTFIFLIFVVSLIIKGKLREEYSFFWFFLGIILLTLSTCRTCVDKVGGYFGVYSPINLTFAALIFLAFVYLLYLSVILSRQKNKIKELSQEIGILSNKINSINKKN